MDKKRKINLKFNKRLLQKRKNKVFGESQVDKYAVGEIIMWPGWGHNDENMVRIYKYGVLLSIYTGIIDKREIKIAEILPFGEDKPVKISLMLVKKSDLKD